jgi:hypothetical protein
MIFGVAMRLSGPAGGVRNNTRAARVPCLQGRAPNPRTPCLAGEVTQHASPYPDAQGWGLAA